MKIFQVDFVTDNFQHSAIVSAENKDIAVQLIKDRFDYSPFIEIRGTKEIDTLEPAVLYHETIYPF